MDLKVATLLIASLFGAQADLTKVKECTGHLDYRPVLDKREDELQFYMQTTAKSEPDCVKMCFEKLHFCYTVMYKPRKDDPSADGVCYFGYYRPDTCDRTTTGQVGLPVGEAENPDHVINLNANFKIFTCIACKENPPSFVQELDENRVGPAQLIKPSDHSNTKSAQSSSVTPISVPNHILLLRESKAFSYLMPKCSGQLQYGVQATLMNRKPKIYAATNETTSIEECAHFCFRQHFCASAFFHNDNCLLSYEVSVCSNARSLPVGYTGSVSISCIECKRQA